MTGPCLPSRFANRVFIYWLLVGWQPCCSGTADNDVGERRSLLQSSRQILSGAGDGEFTVFDSFGCDQFVGQSLDVDSLAANGEDFKAIVVVEMAV